MDGLWCTNTGMVISAMKEVINVKAFPFHVDASERSKNAQMEDIWDGIVL